jgi:hypothetical protein
VKLRDCFLTAAFAPRPAAPLDFGMPAGEQLRPPAPARAAGYRSGRLVVPGQHTIAVRATLPDPTNPHDHANLFEPRRGGMLAMTIEDAHDRFCLTPGELLLGDAEGAAGVDDRQAPGCAIDARAGRVRPRRAAACGPGARVYLMRSLSESGA